MEGGSTCNPEAPDKSSYRGHEASIPYICVQTTYMHRQLKINLLKILKKHLDWYSHVEMNVLQ